MTSARVKEEIMIANLKMDARAENETAIATGCLLLLLDAFDRKVTRDQFLAAATAALQCNDNVGRVAALTAVAEFINSNGGMTRVHLEQARQDVKVFLQKSTAQCLAMAELLTQLSEDGDTIQ